MLMQFLAGGIVSICNITIHALVMTLVVRVARASVSKTDHPTLLLIVTMIAALPRKKANGEVNIRAIRTGTSSLMRVAFCASSTATGSGRPRAVRNSAWDERGTLRRSAFPFAIRSARDKRVALKLLSLASSARLALCRKKSSSLGTSVDPPFHTASLARVTQPSQPAMCCLSSTSNAFGSPICWAASQSTSGI